MRGRGDDGFSLIECVMAVALLGISAAAIVGALGTAAATGGMQARLGDADAGLRSAAELVKSQAYVACPVPPSYDVSTASLAPGMTMSIASIEYWDGSSFQAGCPPTDHGLQRVTVEASAADGAFERTLQVIKRRP